MGERLRQGSMQPTYMDIVLSDGAKVTVVAKFPTRQNRAPAESVINEFIGCRAALIAGIQVPPCYIVEASPHVNLHLVERHSITIASPFGFASKVCPIDALLYPSTLCAMTPEELMRLYCFDMLFLNADRTPNNPNCGQGRGRLFAFDFGSALISPGTQVNAFDRFFFGSGLSDRASAHLCRDFVCSTDLAEGILDEMVDKVAESHWYASLGLKYLPQAMQDQLGLVERYLDYLAQERNTVCRQIVSTV